MRSRRSKKTSRRLKKSKATRSKKSRSRKLQLRFSTYRSKEYDLVYPIQIKTPKTHPHSMIPDFFKGTWRRILPWNWFKEPEEWKEAQQQMLDYIQNKIMASDQTIRKGTKLYHGSTMHPLKLTKDQFTFFGLDALISLWYLSEMYDEGKIKENPGIGYLYEFEVVKPIQVTKILEKLTTQHPFGSSECDKPKGVCIHPQIAYHRSPFSARKGPYDLSVELTLNYKDFKDFIQMNRAFKVNAKELYKNNEVEDYDPSKAIIEEISI